MPKTISQKEPAERPYSIHLSAAEIAALVKYHVTESKRTVKALGKAIESRFNGNINQKELNALTLSTRENRAAHIERAHDLAAIL